MNRLLPFDRARLRSRYFPDSICKGFLSFSTSIFYFAVAFILERVWFWRKLESSLRICLLCRERDIVAGETERCLRAEAPHSGCFCLSFSCIYLTTGCMKTVRRLFWVWNTGCRNMYMHYLLKVMNRGFSNSIYYFAFTFIVDKVWTCCKFECS